MSLSASERAAIAEIGGGEFFDPDLAEKVKASIAANAMTPSVARDFVLDVATRRAEFLRTIKTTCRV